MGDSDVLRTEVISAALNEAIESYAAQPQAAVERRAKLEDRQTVLSNELGRLTQAIAAGGDVPILLAAVREREQERVAVARELAGLAVAKITAPDLRVVRSQMEEQRNDGSRMFGRQPAWTRQLVQKLLTGKITFTPITTDDGLPGYEIGVPLTLERFSPESRVHNVWRPRADSNCRPPA